MDPDESGYLARHLQSQYYFHYYNQVPILQYSYNYGLNQISIPHVPSSIHNASYNPLESPYATRINPNLSREQSLKKKRLTKRLVLLDVQKQIMQKSKIYKSLKKSFNYFDPFRAPPITTLRNPLELQFEYQQQLKKRTHFNNKTFNPQSSSEIILRKLQILIQAPDEKNYPFLICKKRKYYRNLKRRYSVIYFQQRAYFIYHQIPIPLKLEPKHKNRSSRIKKQSLNGVFEYSVNDQSNFESQMSDESDNEVQEHQKQFGIEEYVDAIEKGLEVKKQTFGPVQIKKF